MRPFHPLAIGQSRPDRASSPSRRCLAAVLLLPLAVVLDSCRPASTAASSQPGLALRLQADAPVDAAAAGGPQVEPHLAVDPWDPSRLVAAFMSVSEGPWEVRVHRSVDGGRTWRRSPLPLRGDTYRSFDPWLAWAPDGSALYLVVVEVSRDGVWRLPVFRSADGGGSWSRWGEVPGRTLDRPVLLATAGEIFVLASEAAGGAPVVVARAGGDGGFVVRGRYTPPHALFILAAAAPVGEGVIVFTVTDRSSLQDLRPRPLLAVRYDDATGRFGAAQQLGEALFVGAPALAVDDAPDSTHRGRLYSVWTDREDGGGGALRLAVSDDRGATWSDAATVLPSAPGDGLRTVPLAAVDARGRLGVAWRQHAADLFTGCSHLHLAVSLDGGGAFPLHRRLTGDASCPDHPDNRLDLEGIPFLRRWPGGGDYAGIEGASGRFHLAFPHGAGGGYRIRSMAVAVGEP